MYFMLVLCMNDKNMILGFLACHCNYFLMACKTEGKYIFAQPDSGQSRSKRRFSLDFMAF